jgi:hypothetical protein
MARDAGGRCTRGRKTALLLALVKTGSISSVSIIVRKKGIRGVGEKGERRQ